MKKINSLLSIILLYVFLLGCTPPDDESFRSSTYYLCRTSWISYSDDRTQHLFFYEDGGGKEILTYYYSSGPVYEEYKFQWEWYPDNTTIEMMYGSDDFIYFDQIEVYTDYLKGYFDGYYMEFESY